MKKGYNPLILLGYCGRLDGASAKNKRIGGAHMDDLCHMCDGSGKDSDAVAAASYPDHCTNCGGTGIEPEVADEEDEEDETL
jgi:DnaJ-class molecular chaperone